MSDTRTAPGIAPLLEIMRRLRDPEQGCPWDRQQNYTSLIPHTLEEAHEVADAIDRHDMAELRSELGDLLFQIVFYAQLAEEEGHFDFQQVVDGICDKMTRRHPHVFADAHFDNAEEQTRDWEQQKLAERKGKDHSHPLDDIPLNLPALSRAQKLQSRARQIGLDWPDVQGVFLKLAEEQEELHQAIAATDSEAVVDELGDLLFTCVNLSRHLGHNAEESLRRANRKFSQRMEKVLQLLALDGKQPGEISAEEMDRYWNRAKN